MEQYNGVQMNEYHWIKLVLNSNTSNHFTVYKQMKIVNIIILFR